MESMHHRGPDAAGTYSSGSLVLGHRRLSIIDVDERSNQPMIDPRGRALVFNGEIYNYRELREDLAHSWNFRTASDTEVILAAYDRWGDSCVTRFNGDWALAIHDPDRDVLFLSRDRVGTKPLYFARNGQRFVFSSETRALVEAGVTGCVNRQTLVDFVKRGKNEPGQATLLEDIEALLPGTSMEVHADGRCRTWEYWGPEQIFGAAVPTDFDDAVEAFGDLFVDAVRLRLHADVPVGVCLSGGLDSSLITAVASRLNGEPVRTFSAVAPGYDSDEGRYSDLVAEQCGTEHVRIELDFSNFIDALDRYVVAQEAPAGGVSPLARLLVLERAGRDVTVLLDGQGGDELLAGYYPYHRMFRRTWPDRPLDMDLRPPRVRSRHPRMAEFEPSFLGDLEFSAVYTPPLEWETDEITRMQYQSLRGPGLLSLLHTEDRLTMTRSLEGRVPFLDHRLIEFCFSAPLTFRIDGVDKRLIREMARRRGLLPAEVWQRADKLGFATPYAAMLRAPSNVAIVRSLLHDLIDRSAGIFRASVLTDLLDEHAEGRVDNANRIFRALTMLLYLDRFGYRIVG